MRGRYRFVFLAAVLLAAGVPAHACEPVVPFIYTVAPLFGFSAASGSAVVLLVVVAAKSVLFAFFERRIPRIRAAALMFLGNVLTSIIGVLVASIGSGAGWIGLGIVAVSGWLPSRRLAEVAPRKWFMPTSRVSAAILITGSLLASLVLFAAAQGAIYSHAMAAYWAIKLLAIFLALLASITLTTAWEEWVIWRYSRDRSIEYFEPVLRTNLYVLLLLMTVGAAIMLPKRLKSPDFLVSAGAVALACGVGKKRFPNPLSKNAATSGTSQSADSTQLANRVR